MTIASTPKPKVLFISQSSGSPEHDRKIREVADVHWIEGRTYEESIPMIEEAVRDHGPFIAFGVGLLGLYTRRNRLIHRDFSASVINFR